jgi:hypothetical protein
VVWLREQTGQLFCQHRHADGSVICQPCDEFLPFLISGNLMVEVSITATKPGPCFVNQVI